MNKDLRLLNQVGEVRRGNVGVQPSGCWGWKRAESVNSNEGIVLVFRFGQLWCVRSSGGLRSEAVIDAPLQESHVPSGHYLFWALGSVPFKYSCRSSRGGILVLIFLFSVPDSSKDLPL